MLNSSIHSMDSWGPLSETVSKSIIFCIKMNKILENIDETMKNFRLQTNCLHLTYSTHLNFDDLLVFLQDFGNGVDKYSMVHETGKNQGSDKEYPHTHVLIKWFRRINTLNPRYLDYLGIHPHIRTLNLRDKKYFENVVKYHYKECIPFTNISKPGTLTLVEEIWECKTKEEALIKHVTKPSHVSGVEKIFDSKPKEVVSIKHITKEELFEWQLEVVKEIEEHILLIRDGGDFDNRHINWIYDPVGGTGKSALLSYIMMEVEKSIATTISSHYHLSSQIQKMSNEHGEVYTVCFGITRSATDKDDFYDVLEKLKDGLVCSSKYIGTTTVINSPYVLVLSNYPPNFSKMTYDRLYFRMLNKKNFVLRGTGDDIYEYLCAHIFDTKKINIKKIIRQVDKQPYIDEAFDWFIRKFEKERIQFNEDLIKRITF